MKQFCDAGVHIIGIQEGRAKNREVLCSKYYFSITSGSLRFMHGCELWVTTVLSFSEHPSMSVLLQGSDGALAEVQLKLSALLSRQPVMLA